MSLNQKDLEVIERAISKACHDLGNSLCRPFLLLEAKVDAAESRLSGRMNELSERIDTGREDIKQELDSMHGEIRGAQRTALDWRN